MTTVVTFPSKNIPTEGIQDPAVVNSFQYLTRVLEVMQKTLADSITSSVGGVASFNTRVGAVTLASLDVTTALGFSPVQSFNTRTGAVTLNSADVTTALGFTPAGLVSPAFTGVPTAPTAAPGTNTVQISTCAFVQAAIAGIASGMTMGGGITGGTAPAALFIDTGNVLGQDPTVFKYVKAAGGDFARLSVTGGAITAQIITAQGGSAQSGLGVNIVNNDAYWSVTSGALITSPFWMGGVHASDDSFNLEQTLSGFDAGGVSAIRIGTDNALGLPYNITTPVASVGHYKIYVDAGGKVKVIYPDSTIRFLDIYNTDIIVNTISAGSFGSSFPSPVNSDNSNQPATTAFAHTMLGTSFVSVREPPYNAVGNGVTDDTAAFTAAGSVAPNVTVHVPKGVYRLASNPTPTGNVTWVIHSGAMFAGIGVLNNQFKTATLSAGITNVATSMTISSSTGMPQLSTDENYYAVLSDGVSYEIIKVITITGTAVTMTRAQFGTTARAFGIGTVFTFSHSDVTTINHFRGSTRVAFNDNRSGLTILSSEPFSELKPGWAGLRVILDDGTAGEYWGLPGAGPSAATSDWVALQVQTISNADRIRLWGSNTMVTAVPGHPATMWGIEIDVSVFTANPNNPGFGHASDPGNDYNAIAHYIVANGQYSATCLIYSQQAGGINWKHGFVLTGVGRHTTAGERANAASSAFSTLFLAGSDCAPDYGIDFSHMWSGGVSTIAFNAIRLGQIVGGLSGQIAARQAKNGDAIISLQRNTDTAPTGYVFYYVNAANSVLLFAIDILGNIATSAGISGATLTLSGALSGATTINASSTITGGSFSTTGNLTVHNIASTQNANGDSTLFLKRATDVGPTGDFIRAVNAANSVILFEVNVAGTVIGTSLNSTAAPSLPGGAGVAYGGTTATTVGAAGGASNLPATPLGYINCIVGGTGVKIPYYNA